MKSLPFLLLFIGFLTFGISMTSCGNSKSSEDKGKEYTSAYICPMHCKGSGSDEPGTCPVCKMDYEKNEKHESDGHGHDHDGHDHGDHDGHNH